MAETPQRSLTHGRGCTILVLSRKPRESVTLVLLDGRMIQVTIVEVCKGKARLGFTAPTDVKIMRNELLEETHAELR